MKCVDKMREWGRRMREGGERRKGRAEWEEKDDNRALPVSSYAAFRVQYNCIASKSSIAAMCRRKNQIR
jgi:hypothetical protein